MNKGKKLEIPSEKKILTQFSGKKSRPKQKPTSFPLAGFKKNSPWCESQASKMNLIDRFPVINQHVVPLNQTDGNPNDEFKVKNQWPESVHGFIRHGQTQGSVIVHVSKAFVAPAAVGRHSLERRDDAGEVPVNRLGTSIHRWASSSNPHPTRTHP
jgi:hypothetical protein